MRFYIFRPTWPDEEGNVRQSDNDLCISLAGDETTVVDTVQGKWYYAGEEGNILTLDIAELDPNAHPNPHATDKYTIDQEVRRGRLTEEEAKRAEARAEEEAKRAAEEEARRVKEHKRT